ncbi:MAG: AAA family ATPase [Methanoregula sp.]|nr:AAA family ATPase [Methanoregula sp.]
MTRRPFTIALSGKGGTGKTTISSLLVRSFIDLGEGPVLAVDADPNANLHEALGVTVSETLGSMREEAFTRHIPPGMNRHDYVRYRFRQSLVESEGFDLIAMGRPEGSGCYCFANDLLAECMGDLGRDYRFIVIDTEAGMEHIARGTIGKPDLLLIVSDPGARGLRTIARIRHTATQLGLDKERIRVVFNRFRTGTAPVDTGTDQPFAVIPEDPAIEKADLVAVPVSQVPSGSTAGIAVRDMAEEILNLAKKNG